MRHLPVERKLDDERATLVVKMAVLPTGATTINLTEAEKDWVRTKRDHKSQKKDCGYLDLVVGWPYLLTMNDDVPRGLANGTRCVLQQILLREGAQLLPYILPDSKLRVASVCASQVAGLLMRYSDGEWARKTQSAGQTQLPVGCFILQPPRPSATRLVMNGQQVAVKLQQFQLMPANAMTVHRVQEQTMTGIALGPLRRHKSGATGGAYVGLSRVRAGNQVFLMEKFRLDQPVGNRAEAIEEMNRLNAIADVTLAKVNEALRA